MHVSYIFIVFPLYIFLYFLIFLCIYLPPPSPHPPPPSTVQEPSKRSQNKIPKPFTKQRKPFRESNQACAKNRDWAFQEPSRNYQKLVTNPIRARSKNIETTSFGTCSNTFLGRCLLILVNLILVNITSFGSSPFRVAELRPAILTDLFLYFSSTFISLPGPVMKALDPSRLAPKCSTMFFYEYHVFSL